MTDSFKIVHRAQGWVAASGFWGRERAEKWLAEFRPEMWVDKTLRAPDFDIVEEGPC